MYGRDVGAKRDLVGGGKGLVAGVRKGSIFE